MVGCAYDDTAQLSLPKFCIINDTIASQSLDDGGGGYEWGISSIRLQ